MHELYNTHIALTYAYSHYTHCINTTRMKHRMNLAKWNITRQQLNERQKTLMVNETHFRYPRGINATRLGHGRRITKSDITSQ